MCFVTPRACEHLISNTPTSSKFAWLGSNPIVKARTVAEFVNLSVRMLRPWKTQDECEVKLVRFGNFTIFMSCYKD
jgi:hypothetical protein